MSSSTRRNITHLTNNDNYNNIAKLAGQNPLLDDKLSHLQPLRRRCSIVVQRLESTLECISGAYGLYAGKYEGFRQSSRGSRVTKSISRVIVAVKAAMEILLQDVTIRSQRAQTDCFKNLAAVYKRWKAAERSNTLPGVYRD